MRRRKRFAAFFEAVEVKLDCLSDEKQCLIFAFARRDATGQIRHIGTPTARAFFNHYHIFHLCHLLFQTGLLQDIVCRTRRNIDAGLAGDCNGSRSGGMFELTVTTSGPHQHPINILNPFYQFFDLHWPSMS